MYKLALASLFLCFSADHFSLERKKYSLILVGKIDVDMATAPPVRNTRADSKSKRTAKKSFLTGTMRLALWRSIQIAKRIKSMIRIRPLTLKAQSTASHQFEAMVVIKKPSSTVFYVFSRSRRKDFIYRSGLGNVKAGQSQLSHG